MVCPTVDADFFSTEGALSVVGVLFRSIAWGKEFGQKIPLILPWEGSSLNGLMLEEVIVLKRCRLSRFASPAIAKFPLSF